MQRTPGSTEAALFCRAGRKILYMVNIQNVFYQIAFCKNKNIQKSLANFRLANFRLAYLNLAYLNLNLNFRCVCHFCEAKVAPSGVQRKFKFKLSQNRRFCVPLT